MAWLANSYIPVSEAADAVQQAAVSTENVESISHELHNVFSELMPLAPVMIVSLTAIVVMLLTAIKRNHNLVATTTVIGLNLAALYILFVLLAGQFAPANVMNLFLVDPFTMLYQFVIIVAALACSTLSHAYIETYKDNREELYILMLTSVAGAMLMVASSHYASFFISLELMSILYTAYWRIHINALNR